MACNIHQTFTNAYHVIDSVFTILAFHACGRCEPTFAQAGRYYTIQTVGNMVKTTSRHWMETKGARKTAEDPRNVAKAAYKLHPRRLQAATQS
jgi:hypothetical protein